MLYITCTSGDLLAMCFVYEYMYNIIESLFYLHYYQAFAWGLQIPILLRSTFWDWIQLIHCKLLLLLPCMPHPHQTTPLGKTAVECFPTQQTPLQSEHMKMCLKYAIQSEVIGSILFCPPTEILGGEGSTLWS